MQRLGDRYDLDVEVAHDEATTTWYGRDRVLGCPVGALVLAADDPRGPAVLAAARATATVPDARVLRVVDAGEDASRAYVVTRWVVGTDLARELAAGPLDPERARTLVLDVAEAVTAAAATGVPHLHLTPSRVLLTEDGGVALTGLGVRAALAGDDVPAEESARRDAYGLGALLYVALTGCWPAGPVDGLPGAARIGTDPARPRQVRAGVPRPLDTVCWRALGHAVGDQPGLASPEAVATALRGAAPRPGPRAATAAAGVSRPPWARLALVVAVSLLSVGAALLGWQIASAPPRQGQSTPPPSGAATSATATATTDGALVAPVAVTAFDPAGDLSEHDTAAPLAVDGDPTTAWTTLAYASPDLGALKPGVGLRLDLGQRREVSSVTLDLVGSGTDLAILASPTLGARLADYRQVAVVHGAADNVVIRLYPAVSARSLVVWLTRLPADGSAYRGGVAEVVVRQ